MEFIKIKELGKQISEKYGYPVPTIKMNTRIIVTTGKCWPQRHIIELSKKYCDFAADKDIEDLIKHEIAHLKHPNHGWGFKVACMEMGVSHGFRGSHSETDGYSEHIGKHAKVKYECPNCGKISSTLRPYKRIHSCGKCCPGVFNSRYELKRIL